jgi:carbamoylphosphate synthase large subunit
VGVIEVRHVRVIEADPRFSKLNAIASHAALNEQARRPDGRAPAHATITSFS